MKRKKRHTATGTRDTLTAKQRKFCELYVVDLNGTAAYKQAYQGVKNDNVAAVSAHKLLRNPKISERIRDLEQNISKTIGVSKIRILLELKKLSFSSIAHLHDTWITRKEFESLTQDQKDCIAEISTQTRKQVVNEELIEVEYVKIKLYDKLKALEVLHRLSGFDPNGKIDLNFDFDRMSDESLQKVWDLLSVKLK